MSPTLIGCCASAGETTRTAAAKPAKPTSRLAVLPRSARAQQFTPPLAREKTARHSLPRSLLSELSAATRPRRILDLVDLVERDIDELAADLLHPPDIDRLHDVSRLGIDRHLAARAIPRHALGRGDQGLAVGLAPCPLQ